MKIPTDDVRPEVFDQRDDNMTKETNNVQLTSRLAVDLGHDQSFKIGCPALSVSLWTSPNLTSLSQK